MGENKGGMWWGGEGPAAPQAAHAIGAAGTRVPPELPRGRSRMPAVLSIRPWHVSLLHYRQTIGRTQTTLASCSEPLDARTWTGPWQTIHSQTGGPTLALRLDCRRFEYDGCLGANPAEITRPAAVLWSLCLLPSSAHLSVRSKGDDSAARRRERAAHTGGCDCLRLGTTDATAWPIAVTVAHPGD